MNRANPTLPPRPEKAHPHAQRGEASHHDPVHHAHLTAGVFYAVAAYLAWGLSPIYFKGVASVPADEVLAHRVIWSAVFLVALLLIRRGFADFVKTLRSARAMRTLSITTLLIATNWFLYIWSVSNDHILEASLGYFINPLVTVALGVIFLKEPLTRARVVALLFACAGVVYLAIHNAAAPWLSLTLACSFATYSLLRKRTHVDAVTGQAVETALLTPFALAFIAWLMLNRRAHFPSESATVNALLPLAGIVTTTPLLWYTIGARRIRLSTMGFLQYIAPTGQFLLAVALYHERFTPAHAIAFALIWIGIAIYAVETARSLQQRGRGSA